MADPVVLATRAFTADQRTLEVVKAHGTEEQIEALTTMNVGGNPPNVGQPEHAAFLSEAVAALAEIVASHGDRLDHKANSASNAQAHKEFGERLDTLEGKS